MKRVLASVLLAGITLAANLWGQSGNATVSGSVADATGALLPGVTVTATSTQTGVVTSVLSNETGTYNFASLQPGTYRVTAELPGFQIQTYTDVQLGTSQQVRLNFTLQISTVAQAVEVTVAADTLLATSSSSVGGVLPDYRVRDLPVVGRDALELVSLLPGVREADSNIGSNRATATFAGIYAGAGAVNTTRDGISVNDGRYQVGVYASTRINPDLVGEMRVIVAPVDAETGRGVGQVQILTKSGTNEFRGTAVWNIQNSAFNANSWNGNRVGTLPTWYNRHQLTGSYGGPIVRNKTFFFALVDGQRMYSRQNIAVPVLTAEARRGNFRFFPGVVNGNADQVAGGAGNTTTAPVVDVFGNPVRPAAATGDLQTFSVFGRDPLRPGLDRSGFIQRMLASMPLPNDFRSSECIQLQQAASCAQTGATSTTDGLNLGNHRWVRRGDTLIGNQFGTEEDTNRNQINVKVDRHFNSNHKLSANFTAEKDTNVASPSPWPGGWEGKAVRRPQVLTTNFVSTLTPSVVNEFRLGRRRGKSNTFAPCLRPEYRDDVLAYLPVIDGYPVIPRPQGFGEHRLAGGCGPFGVYSPMWTAADSVSWTKGKHTYKGGAEVRLAKSSAFSSVGIIPELNGGAGNFPVTNIETALIPGLIGTSLTTARNLLLTLSGSLSTIRQDFRLYDPSATEFLDFKQLTQGCSVGQGCPPTRTFVQNEWSAFFKDDWKVTPSLSLNLGVRYEFYAVPWEESGFTGSPVGGGNALFSWTGRSFDDYWRFGPQKGGLTAIELVGPNSPNPGKQLHKDDWNNFAPAVGFSWSLPWFGKDMTTIRSGYGVSYIGTGGRASALDAAVGMAPGITDSQTVPSQTYLDMTNARLPVPRNKPLQPLSIFQRTQSITGYDPNLINAYVQTFNFSVTRTIRRNVVADLRYVGTKGTKLYGSVPINQPNYLTNGLIEALNITRAGGDAPLFDQMLKGLNLNPGVTGFGPVGTTVNGILQTGSMHLRQSTTYRGNIANGNYTAVASSLNTSTQITGLGGGLIRNGGFPENFIANNPQFNNVTLNTNPGSSAYHSFQAQVTFRPTSGLSYQTTYVWSKAMTSCTNSNCSSWTNVLNRSLDRTLQDSHRAHDFRFNGSFALPFGPGRQWLGDRSGILARLVEQWQLSWIFNATSGAPLSVASTNTYVGAGRPQIVGDFPKNQGKAAMTAALPVYFEPGTYRTVTDPQCASVTTLQGMRTACTLGAITDAQGRSVLQHALPGTLGNLGENWIEGPGRFNFDLSASKTVKIDELKSLQFRIDARNVLNHPILGNPNLNINSPDFGRIPADQVSGARQFQAQLRFSF
jgi:hypothetical protein